MTDQHTQPAPFPASTVRRCNADYRWTVPKVTAFLRALARTGKVSEAAREVGMSRQSAYRLKARLDHPQFQHMFAVARTKGRVAREEARRPASPWGKPGLAGLAHLMNAGPQGDTLSSYGDGSGSQGDGFQAQGDAIVAKASF